MGKKCVRSATLVGLAAAALIGAVASISAQVTDPATLPLLAASGMEYLGGFRLPAESVNGDSFSIGGRQMTFNPAGNSLFIGSRAGRIAEVSIPVPVNSTNVNALPFATFLQPFADPTEGHLSEVAPDGVSIDGLLVYGNRLHGTASIYYDANNTQRVSHYSRSLRLNQPSFSGWSQVWESGKTGFVSGYMALVPAEWRERLGGPATTGQGGIPIAWRTSWGPAALAFNPALIGQAVVPATPLLYYTGEHATLGRWDSSNPTYGATSNFGGMAIISGTRTALYWGRNGIGPHCYGNGTSNQSLHGTTGPDGATWCYDPTTSDKGSHAYPYRYQVWAYDLNDLAAVRQGTKQPWEVVPYGVWPLTLPTAEPSVTVGGVAYDAAQQILYVSQLQADQDGYSFRPVIHAFKISAAAGKTPETVTAVQIGFDKASPQQVHTSITATATPTGGVAPHEYRWSVSDGNAWTPATDWSTADHFSWVPTAANANYQVGVWVRSAGNTTADAEALAAQPYQITEAPSAAVTNVTLVANQTAPQPPATPITFTASAVGGAAPTEYKWLVFDGGGWTALTGWSALNTFVWTPGQANADYRVGVWARSAGITADEPQASASQAFAIASTGSRVDSVTVTANKTAPQLPGTAILWTATATGGTGSREYKWLVYDGARWTASGSWTSSSTFTWTPAIADPNYRVGVWVRTAGNTVDAEEASAWLPFPIEGPPTSATPAPTPAPAPTTRVTSVSLSANRIAPQAPRTTITATATVVGGTAPYSFKWLIYDGAKWKTVGNWTSSNTFAWTPVRADPNYTIGVWVRSAGNTNDEPEVSATLAFPIK